MVNDLLHGEKVFGLYWLLHKREVLPLLAAVLVASELATPDWKEMIEAYIAEAMA